MAIVEMLKLKLYGINSEKPQILDALFDTRQIELKTVEEIENTTINFDENSYQEQDKYRQKLLKTIQTIETQLESMPNKTKTEGIFDVSSDEFKSINTQKQEIDQVLEKVDVILNRQNDIKKEITNLTNKITQLTPYLEVKEDFNMFKNTKHTSIMLGTISASSLKEFQSFLTDCPLTTYEVCGSEGNILKVYSHNSESFIVSKKLNELGFVQANFNLQGNAEGAIKNYQKQIDVLNKENSEIIKKFCDFKDSLKPLKILYDYLSFTMEKLDADNKFRSTSQVFVLEAYLQKDSREKVDKKLKTLGDSIEYEFLEVPADEMPPTVTKNTKVVSQFEFVTNMYSPPHYREIDPNAFLAFFFSVFFGFVMADIGYGITLFAFGIFMALRQKRNTGFKKLMYVIAIGGIFTIIFGILFGSFFGLSHENWALVPPATLPNPVTNVITLLVACLAAGVVQIMVSFILKGILLIRRKHVWEAIFTAFTWDFFFIGLALFLLEYANIYKGLGNVGLIIAIGSVAISVVGLAIINKGFERVSKPFGAVYGIINLFSDILSYARLFGLMLSGAIIASIVNTLAADFLTSPVTFLVGVIVLAIGHAFNLAMGALGGYIHVARLQYIEFFSRFYEGEGELFVPFGTNFSYINLI